VDLGSLETLQYREDHGVAWVTLNRPERLNAFNTTMAHELRTVWRALRANADVNCAVLTAAGDRAFCTGIDRSEVNVDWVDQMAETSTTDRGERAVGFVSPFMLDDPGEYLGPKSNDLWKPVIAAVNGMACGGAFYMLGEADFVIAAEHATFFDPHTTYGMPTCFEPVHMLQKMPFHEIMRISLLGNAERMSAKRAHELGLVTEVVPGEQLAAAAQWAGETIASYAPLAVQATVRSLWAALDMGRTTALNQCYTWIAMGTSSEGLRQGQEQFASGRRQEWRLR
jgi:enoyl-CoA hydratase/carnithine racemase